MNAWITVIGIGEGGLESLSAEARAIVAKAEVLVGGDRHLAMVRDAAATKIAWGKKFKETVASIEQYRGQKVVVLASGDPMHFGAGRHLFDYFDEREITIVPSPGAFSLAAARMGWSVPDATCLTVHGRPLELVNLYLRPDARLLVLSWDGATPGKLAALLTKKGFGGSTMSVLEHMGGAAENRIDGRAEAWTIERTADLNVIAVACVAAPDAVFWSRAPGLPERAFKSDNMITKREVRAATIAALAPLPGETLWDVGAGSGSVGVEWLRLEPSAKAVAIERNAERAGFARANATDLGVPSLRVVEADAPDAFAGLLEDGEAPNAMFVGGGISKVGLLDACWKILKPGGRLVANAVTLEAQGALLAFRRQHGGALTGISVSRDEAVGRLSGLRPAMTVWQLRSEKV